MHDFFKGWRRKIGVATLVTACVFACCWIRSLTVVDWFILPSTMSPDRVMFNGEITSGFQEITWTTTEVEWDEYIPCLNLEWYSSPIESSSSDGYLTGTAFWDGPPWLHRDWNFGGFRFADSEMFSNLIGRTLYGRTWSIPYWSIVAPLTLHSAWLLLSKPRVAKRPAQQSI